MAIRPSTSSLIPRLSPLSHHHRLRSITWASTGAVDHPRRYLAHLVSGTVPAHPPSSASNNIGRSQSSGPPSLLDALLIAIRTHDTAAKTTAFLSWTHALASSGDDRGQQHAHLLRQLDTISSPVMSEIIRSMDPITHPGLDVAHALNITQGHTLFTDAGKLMDEFGVRVHHARVIEGMWTIIQLREKSRYPLRPVDFDVLFRLVGASMEYTLPPKLLSIMKNHGLHGLKRIKTRLEFLKARFMTDPVYYHYDRARVMMTARSTMTWQDVINPDMRQVIWDMDRVRFSENAFKRQPWNRRRDEPQSDIRRLLRRSRDSDYRSYWNHFVRYIMESQDADPETIPISIEGFSRSNDLEAIFELILKPYYGIEFDSVEQTITGGFDIPKSSTVYPTDRLLYSIIEAFGIMNEISLGMRLTDFISRRYSVPISHKVWSNLLSWAFTNASSTPRAMSRASGIKASEHINAKDVLHVWSIMTSPPYSIKPSFEDIDIHIKALIITRNFSKAIQTIRHTAMPFYRSSTLELEESLMDEILLSDNNNNTILSATSYFLSTARQRRLQAETHKDFISNRIACWFSDILRTSSSSHIHRSSSFTHVTIPSLIAEFSPFFLPFSGIRYRTSTGEVRIFQSSDRDASARFDYHHSPIHDGQQQQQQQRVVLRQKVSSLHVSREAIDRHGRARRIVDSDTGREYENPEFEWPANNAFVLREKRNVPKVRRQWFGPPPGRGSQDGDRRAWWGELEKELMI